MECVVCTTSEESARFTKCPICFKWVCENCGTHGYGRIFCSKRCSDLFFFGDDEE